YPRRFLLRAAQPAGAGGDHAGPVRGAAGGGDRAAADLRPRYPARRRQRAGVPGGGHGDRRGDHRDLVLVPADEVECRREDADRHRRVRPGDPDIRPVDVLLGQPGRADRRGGRGHGIRLCAHLADPAAHPRCDARA
ncbi:hypothetical protein LTR94_032897, partial [Friedmanniomyces endolithicus]